MHLNNILTQLRSSSPKVPVLLALVATLGCWSEVEYEEPDKVKTEPPAVESPTTPPPVAEESTTSEDPAPEVGSEPVVESTPTVEEPPPTEPPSESLTFEEWLSANDTPVGELPEAESPPTSEEPAQPAKTPSVGGRYAPTTTPTLTDPPESSETASENPVGGRYATTPPAEESTTPPPVSETPSAAAESTRSLMPWERPEEKPETESTETPTEPPTESIEESATEVVPLVETPSPVEESPPLEPAPSPEPPVEEPPMVESRTEVFSPAAPDSPLEAAPLPPLDPQNTRNLAWLLGSKWSLWLLSEHAGAPVQEQEKFSQECQTVAKVIGVELPKTPPFSASRPTAAFLESILSAGRELGSSIGKSHGPEEMALFEASMKSNLLLVLADSRPDLNPAVLRAVTDAAKRANVSDELLQPFTTALSGSPSPEQVDQAVFDFHRSIEESLRNSGGTP